MSFVGTDTDTGSGGAIPSRRFSIGVYWLAVILVLLAAGGLLMVLRFGEMTYQRDLQGWQEKLNLIADSRAQAVRQWVDDQFFPVRSLADNASLQLYMTQLSVGDDNSGGDRDSEPPAEALYLRNLLVVTAQQGGFLPADSERDHIPANVEKLAQSGIAITDMQWNILVSTRGFPPLTTGSASKDRLVQLAAGNSHLLDITTDTVGSDELRIGFVAPIYAIQGERDASSQIGWVIGLRVVGKDLFDLLRHPGATEETLEAVLLRESEAGGEAEYISPLSDGSAPLEKRLSLSNGELAAAKALGNPGSFSLARDYNFTPVLMTSRRISGTDWVLLLKISREEALAASESWRGRMIFMLLMAVGLALLLIVAAWWYGTSKEAKALAARQRKLAEDYAKQEQLLRLVTDNEPNSLFIVDGDMRCHFANNKAAQMAGVSPEDMTGKTLASLLGSARARIYEQHCKAVIANNKNESIIHRANNGISDDDVKTLHCEFVAIDNIPLASLSDATAGVLIIEQDITAAVSERERRERMLDQLIDILVKMVDERDPYAANHSAVVSRLAHEVAHEMDLDSTLCETAALAGKLLNIGKITLPPELLTKSKTLDIEEKESIYDALARSARLLSAIEFDGPVVETLQQARERFDGSGEQGLSGDDILVTARIISVVNAFVAMTSPRSWRDAIDIDSAVKGLLEEVDKSYDRKVVAALINYLDNRGGRADFKRDHKAAS